MFEYVKIDRRIIYYLIIIGFFLSFNHWDNLFIGISNFLFASIFSIISYFIILLVFNFVSSFYGIYISLDFVVAELKLLYYKLSTKQYYYYLIFILIFLFFIFRNNLFLFLILSIIIISIFYLIIENIKKRQKESKQIGSAFIKRINMSYWISIMISLITFGFFVPIVFSIKPILIEYKRIGKGKNIEISNNELLRIFLISMLILWIIYSSIKYLSSFTPILYGFVEYFFNFLFFFTYTSIIPIGILLSPYISISKGYYYTNKFIGDLLILSSTPFYISTIITVAILPILSIIFNPIEVIIFSILIFAIVWVRKQFDVLTK
ncbi:MAG: hypothetical protein ACP5GJ_00895 [Nanopusillaceae archaeon]|jgi:hypothetical protein